MRAHFYLFFVIAILISGGVQGQILIGPAIGGQYSWTSFGEKDVKDFYSARPMFGYHAGVGVSFRVRNRFFLTSSLLYSTKGRIIVGKEDQYLRHESTWKYIDVPIIYSVDFRGRTSDNHEFKYFLGIGPNLSYWLGGRGTLYNSDYFEAGRPEMKYKIRFDRDSSLVGENEMLVRKANRIQLGLNLAAGITLEPMPRQKFIFIVRYEFGHSFLAPRSNGGEFPATSYQENLQSRNQGGRISLYYLVDMKTEDRKRGKSTSTIRPKKKRRR